MRLRIKINKNKKKNNKNKKSTQRFDVAMTSFSREKKNSNLLNICGVR